MQGQIRKGMVVKQYYSINKIMIYILSILVFARVCSDVVADEEYGYVEWIDFCIKNESNIVSYKQGNRQIPPETKGLELNYDQLIKLKLWKYDLTNLLYLRITSEAVDPLPVIVSPITNFPKLEYLHLQIRQARNVGNSISVFTNLTNLKYLGIDAPLTTNIDVSIYRLKTLKELMLRAYKARIPDGIADLTNLKKLTMYGDRSIECEQLPADLKTSGVESLELMGISCIENSLPNLPRNLIELYVVGCRLKHIPRAWLKHDKLQIMNANMNILTRFPAEITEIPSLRIIGLDLNKITNVPPIEISEKRNIKIFLNANPIVHFAPENKILVERGVIIK